MGQTDEEIRALGVNLALWRFIYILLVALIVSVSTAAGEYLLGWINHSPISPVPGRFQPKTGGSLCGCAWRVLFC